MFWRKRWWDCRRTSEKATPYVPRRTHLRSCAPCVASHLVPRIGDDPWLSREVRVGRRGADRKCARTRPKAGCSAPCSSIAWSTAVCAFAWYSSARPCAAGGRAESRRGGSLADQLVAFPHSGRNPVDMRILVVCLLLVACGGNPAPEKTGPAG